MVVLGIIAVALVTAEAPPRAATLAAWKMTAVPALSPRPLRAPQKHPSIVPRNVRRAHSWYPMECCERTHCHEADMVRELPDGTAQVQVGSDTIVVHPWLKRRTSPDQHYHVCYTQWDEVTVVYCFFEPGQA